jgi:predicted nucleic acid-binding protein
MTIILGSVGGVAGLVAIIIAAICIYRQRLAHQDAILRDRQRIEIIFP